MCRIELTTDSVHIIMPADKNLGIFEACWRADIYKKKNSKATFTVVDEETGDILYQV